MNRLLSMAMAGGCSFGNGAIRVMPINTTRYGRLIARFSELYGRNRSTFAVVKIPTKDHYDGAVPSRRIARSRRARKRDLSILKNWGLARRRRADRSGR